MKEQQITSPAAGLESSPVFTVPEMAEFLKVPLGQARSLIRRGAVRYMRVGKQYIVPRADIEAWLAGNWQRKGTPR